MSAALRYAQISDVAFAPFGRVLRRPALGEGPLHLQAELHNGRPAVTPRLALNTVRPRELPLTATKMERHVHSSQTFVPVDCENYLVLVAPRGVEGFPDLSALRAFNVPGDVGVHYFANTWHHPLTALGRPATFVVLTFLDGGPDDEEWFTLPEPVRIEA
jgi:ureidoglycolate lyase